MVVRHYSEVEIKRSSFYSILENLKPLFLPKGKLEAVAKKENELKIFFWSAISSVGACSAFFTPSRLVANKDIYIRKCLLKPLLSFTKKIHSDDNCAYIFWPDKANSHYAKDSVNFLTSSIVKICTKSIQSN